MRKALVWLLAAVALPTRALAQSTAAPRPNEEARVLNSLGVTGLLFIPSASVLRDRELSASVAGRADFVAGGAAAGIGDRLEIGIAAVNAQRTFARPGTRWLGNPKLNLFRETLLLPAFSVGVVDAFDALHRGSGWYLVTSKSLIRYFGRALTRKELAVKLHLGYGGGIYGREPFGGAELFLPGSLGAMAEVSDGKINMGVRFYASGFQATVGLFDLDRVGGGVSYTASLR